MGVLLGILMVDHTGALFEELLQIMSRLRGEEGCPWDREQTRDSLKPFLIEEAYEVLEALEERTPHDLREELGDLLFQVIFHAQIARELNEFTMEGVLQRLTEKMVRRHPHVFGNGRVNTAAEALAQWEAIKQVEGSHDHVRSVLDGVPRTLPALLRAQRIQAKASRVGFDWNDPTAAWQKVHEELREIDEALHQGDHAKATEEVGDLLFALVNVARLLKVDAEGSLQRSVEKFRRRFAQIELRVAAEGRSLQDCSLEELNRYWEATKVRDPVGSE
jgi:tetrapyrrole methylase family protein/MazG family protein